METRLSCPRVSCRGEIHYELRVCLGQPRQFRKDKNRLARPARPHHQSVTFCRPQRSEDERVPDLYSNRRGTGGMAPIATHIR